MSGQVTIRIFHIFTSIKKSFLAQLIFDNECGIVGTLTAFWGSTYSHIYTNCNCQGPLQYVQHTAYIKYAHPKKKKRSLSHFYFHTRNNPIPRQSIDETVKKTHKSRFFVNSCTNLGAFHCN